MLVPCMIGKNPYPLCLGTSGGQAEVICLPVVACICVEKQVFQNPPCTEDILQLVTVLVGQAADKQTLGRGVFQGPCGWSKACHLGKLHLGEPVCHPGGAGWRCSPQSAPLLLGQKGLFVSGTDLPGLVCAH